jgi:hypothetical protein
MRWDSLPADGARTPGLEMSGAEVQHLYKLMHVFSTAAQLKAYSVCIS